MLGDMIPLKLGAGVLLKHKDLSVIMGYSKMILAHHLKAQCMAGYGSFGCPVSSANSFH